MFRLGLSTHSFPTGPFLLTFVYLVKFSLHTVKSAPSPWSTKKTWGVAKPKLWCPAIHDKQVCLSRGLRLHTRYARFWLGVPKWDPRCSSLQTYTPGWVGGIFFWGFSPWSIHFAPWRLRSTALNEMVKRLSLLLVNRLITSCELVYFTCAHT